MEADRARSRLAELERERERGLEALRGLDARRHELRETLLRIQGAIQVLEELVAREEAEADSDACPST